MTVIMTDNKQNTSRPSKKQLIFAYIHSKSYTIQLKFVFCGAFCLHVCLVAFFLGEGGEDIVLRLELGLEENGREIWGQDHI